ncbi:MAG: deoxyribose-phosphate aldolase [Alicyclobacillaceae bacterium]|nr:deoxyribose-phosphate aldolase [Alicyclobacillaceae bacterium]
MTRGEIARYIDHTLLQAAATPADIDRLCDEANTYGFAAVCVNPVYVKRCRARVTGGVRVAAVVGFPLGANSVDAKVFEAHHVMSDGADEIDMVIHLGALRSGDRDYVRREIAAVVQAAKSVRADAVIKVIIETSELTQEEKRIAAMLAVEAGADYVKTSTGFSRSGATVEDVRLLKETVGGQAKIKASGGIRTFADAVAMIEAGADRIGTSAGVAIVRAGSGADS